MKNYRDAMEHIVLSRAADERIMQAILRAEKNREEPFTMKKRKFSTALVTAALVLVCGATAYAAGARIVMKLRETKTETAVSYEAADDAFIELGTWLPAEVPAGYERTFVSDPFDGEQTVVYENDAGETIRYTYAKAGHFSEVYLENADGEDVRVGGQAGRLYTNAGGRDLFWTNAVAGIGYHLQTDDPTVDLIAMAEGVSAAEALVPTYKDRTQAALEELGDHAPSEIPAAYSTCAVTGCPTENGGGWYGYVRKSYTDEAENREIFFQYETYRTEDPDASAEDVLTLFNVKGSSVSVNGLPGILAEDGTALYWIDPAQHLRFTLRADAICDDALLTLAETSFKY